MTDEDAVERLPVVNSEYLFLLLVKQLNVDLICDVGAFDCAHSRQFRRSGARVAAIEANPFNFAALVADSSIAAAGIELFNYAAWNEDGEVTFNMIQVPNGSLVNQRNPISSVRARTPGYEFESRPVCVPATRLDTLVRRKLGATAAAIAVWIDVEGAAHEVLQGMEDVHESVRIVHVEIETREFWQNQRLWPAVAALLRDFGFTPLARSAGNLDGRQLDVLFINTTWCPRAAARWAVGKAWCRLRADRVRQELCRIAKAPLRPRLRA
jgi:FkbM family methyltransferase